MRKKMRSLSVFRVSTAEENNLVSILLFLFMLQNYAAMKMVGPFGLAKSAEWWRKRRGKWKEGGKKGEEIKCKKAETMKNNVNKWNETEFNGFSCYSSFFSIVLLELFRVSDNCNGELHVQSYLFQINWHTFGQVDLRSKGSQTPHTCVRPLMYLHLTFSPLTWNAAPKAFTKIISDLR